LKPIVRENKFFQDIYTSGCKKKKTFTVEGLRGGDAESSNGYIQMGLPKSQVPPGPQVHSLWTLNQGSAVNFSSFSTGL